MGFRIVGLGCALFFLVGSVAGSDYVRIDLRYPGVYRITGRELAEAGVTLGSLRPETMGVFCRGEAVPVRVDSGGDGDFGISDFVEFVGDAARGTTTWFLPENKYNVYFLRWDVDGAVQYEEGKPARADETTRQHFWQMQHLEKNYQFWFSTLPPGVTDNFYWFPFLAGNTPDQALATNVDFPGFDRSLNLPVDVRIRLLGATKERGLKPSHAFDFLYDGKRVGEVRFDDVALHDLEVSLLPEGVKEEPGRISFRTPEGRGRAVDKIYVDWIDTRYPSEFDGNGAEYYRFNNDLVEPDRVGAVHVRNLPKGASVFDPVAGRVWQLGMDQESAAVPVTDERTTYTAVAPFARMRVDRIERVLPDVKADELPQDLQALVIYHPRLWDTANRLTEYRRKNGWKIQAVSVRSIFDQRNDGFISDDALKQYLSDARDRAPGLSHIVLLGDAYFDFREARSQRDERQLDVLIPIHWVHQPGVAWSGGYQDDNWYGSFANEYRADVAVGRIPVNDDREGLAYLEKLMAYEAGGLSFGDPAVMVSSMELQFQDYVKEVGKGFEERGTTVSYLFPRKEQGAEAVAALADAFDSGARLVYYVGHGGSMVWRVGPEDFSQQKDLFTVADAGKLRNRGHYPVVVASSCYTTAFEQPEGIGEALIKKPEGGAVAVVGSPWKVTVEDAHKFNRKLIVGYLDREVRTLGDVLVRTHRDHVSEEQAEPYGNTYMLLGDPCLSIRPEGRNVPVEIEKRMAEPAGELMQLLAADFPEGREYRGEVLVSGGVVSSREFVVPAGAAFISLTALARQAADVFPRVKIGLVTARGNRVAFYEGYWQSVVQSTMRWELPPVLRGRGVRVVVEVLNPGVAEEERMFYLRRVGVE